MPSAQRNRRSQAKKSPKPLWIGLGALAIILLGVLAFSLLNNGSNTTSASVNAVEETFADEGRDHVENSERVKYSTNPPTSGKHWGNPAQWGLYRENPPEDERLVHNMEHGGVIIWFDPAKTSDAEYNQLLSVYQSLSRDQYRTILVARPNMDHKIALTAWRNRLTMDGFDEKTIRTFFDKFILMGPECVERRCPA